MDPEAPSTSPADLLEVSGKSYLEHVLSRLAASTVRDALLQSHQNALEHKTDLEPSMVPFSAAMLRGLSRDILEGMLNPYALGIGNVTAKTVIVGRAAGFDLLKDLVTASLECFANAVVWLSQGKGSIIAHLTGRRDWGPDRKAYHLYPAEYHGKKISSGHTWRKLAAVLGVGLNEIGTQTYQVELTHIPSKSGGKAATRERAAFLEEIIGTVRPTAKLLLFNGAPVNGVACRQQQLLARVFLGADPRWEDDPSGLFSHAASDGRAVVATEPHLSRSISPDELRTIGTFVRPLIERSR